MLLCSCRKMCTFAAKIAQNRLTNMNFVFISPHFPHTYWQFCQWLYQNGVKVLAIADAPYTSWQRWLYHLMPKAKVLAANLARPTSVAIY